MRRDHSRNAARRRGMTLFEVFATSSLLGFVIVLVPPMIQRLILHKQSIDRQQWVQTELTNVLEDLAARPYAEITPEAAERVTLSENARDVVDEAQLTVTVNDVASEGSRPAGRKVSASIRWPLRTGGDRVASLTTWVYPEGH